MYNWKEKKKRIKCGYKYKLFSSNLHEMASWIFCHNIVSYKNVVLLHVYKKLDAFSTTIWWIWHNWVWLTIVKFVMKFRKLCVSRSKFQIFVLIVITYYFIWTNDLIMALYIKSAPEYYLKFCKFLNKVKSLLIFKTLLESWREKFTTWHCMKYRDLTEDLNVLFGKSFINAR